MGMGVRFYERQRGSLWNLKPKDSLVLKVLASESHPIPTLELGRFW